ncbi:MAG TPA: TonB-dependent receptor, partial [Thermoanaerobaculia bacterium]|nr:TonB-dependent receptor [Thermoanaerobaculia bacterium]
MKHVLRKGQVAALIVLLFAGGVYAQDKKDETSPPAPVKEEITVTGTRFERPIDLTPQSISVLPSEEIHTRPMWNVQSLLEDVPGVSFSRTGAVDGQVVIRGFSSGDSRQVLFIDGDRFRGRVSLEYSFLDPNEIDRLEIIRGPAAALYGADAMNGVVNAITHRATGDPLQKGFSLRPRLYALGVSSTNRLGAARLELEGVGNGFDMLIGGNYRTAGNYDSPRGEIPNSDFTIRSLNARIGYSPTATRRFEVIGKLANVETGRANAPGAPLVITRNDPLKEQSLRLAYTESQVSSWIQDVEASLYVRDMNTIIRSRTATAANGNVEFRDTWVIGPTVSGGKLLARSVLGKSLLSYGIDLYNENVPPFEDEVRVVNKAGAPVSFSPRADRIRAVVQTDAGAFGHYDWDPSTQLTVSLGGRYDAVRTNIDSKPALDESPQLSAAFARSLTANDHALTGSAGVIFRPVSALHFVGNISTAFRTPTTFDKSGSGVVGALNTLPNADLKPESSKT